MTDETMKKMKKFFAVKWVIYATMVATMFFYFALCVILKKQGIKMLDDDGLIVILRNVFAGVALVLMFIAFFVRRKISSAENFKNMLESKDINPQILQRFAKSIDDESIIRVSKALILSNTIDIISWILLESVAVLGLLLFLLSGNIFYIQAFGGIALIAMAFFRPNFSNFLTIVEYDDDSMRE
ncbi:hypothetical protein ACFL2A_00010 [Thermodesulfobacteriota bacterium]